MNNKKNFWYLKLSELNISMIIFAIFFAILLNVVKNKTTYGADTIISVFSSIAISIGLAILAQSGDFNRYSSYLVGDILSITKEEILYLFVALIEEMFEQIKIYLVVLKQYIIV